MGSTEKYCVPLVVVVVVVVSSASTNVLLNTRPTVQADSQRPATATRSSSTTVCYGHLRLIIEHPHSSYSALLIHISWKVPRLPRMLPPSQEAIARSCFPGASILTLQPGVCAWMMASICSLRESGTDWSVGPMQAPPPASTTLPRTPACWSRSQRKAASQTMLATGDAVSCSKAVSRYGAQAFWRIRLSKRTLFWWCTAAGSGSAAASFLPRFVPLREVDIPTAVASVYLLACRFRSAAAPVSSPLFFSLLLLLLLFSSPSSAEAISRSFT
mmetsp:Transcript_12573/g.29033  ORF Transcript_12573/g.29033 Transcript_12573/m.29033 type:complete len:272 (-) Transcript_12573:79-894(-)